MAFVIEIANTREYEEQDITKSEAGRNWKRRHEREKKVLGRYIKNEKEKQS